MIIQKSKPVCPGMCCYCQPQRQGPRKEWHESFSQHTVLQLCTIPPVKPCWVSEAGSSVDSHLQGGGKGFEGPQYESLALCLRLCLLFQEMCQRQLTPGPTQKSMRLLRMARHRSESCCHLSSALPSISGVLSSDSSRLIWCPSGRAKLSSGKAWRSLLEEFLQRLQGKSAQT